MRGTRAAAMGVIAFIFGVLFGYQLVGYQECEERKQAVTEAVLREWGLQEEPTLPPLLDGDINMPEVMYQSVVLLKKVYKTGKLHLGECSRNCGHPTICTAFRILMKAFGEKHINLDNKIFHLNILRNRLLARHPRPPSCHGCFTYNFTTLISPRDVCQNNNRTIDLFILLTTIPKAADARMAVRETWLQYAESNQGNIRYLFLIGGGWSADLMTQVKEENEKYGDILVEDYMDSYYNLSYKVHGGFRWAVKHCSEAKYVSRAADDIYLNVPKVLHYLKMNERNMSDTMVGTCHSHASIDRKRWSRHYQSKNDYPQALFGPFCVGKTFIMSTAAIRKIVKVGPDIPWFNLEDHWVGFAGEKARLKVRSVKGFNVEYYPDANIDLFLDWRKKMGICSFDKDWYNLHRTRPSDIRAVYEQCINNHLY